MNLPNWDEEPWANFRAMDDGGDWYWYKLKPTKGNGFWIAVGHYTLCLNAEEWDESLGNWEDTLEERPK